ncbi:hypothetical protein NDU88_005701 [Pleurodeles waltl]|uniref:Uncharacterized protein n=1 Tax=Pleurodeles waltl TaxID=8319 RepID=A0AAV7L1K8_PLEWA|nr:hypothetical protein NDU88_005701 [Pleurodeles waltl]
MTSRQARFPPAGAEGKAYTRWRPDGWWLQRRDRVQRYTGRETKDGVVMDPLGPRIPWGHGPPGTKDPLGSWTPWDQGSLGVMDPLGPRIPWGHGSHGTKDPLGSWIPWNHGSLGVMDPMEPWIPWGHGSPGTKHPLGRGYQMPTSTMPTQCPRSGTTFSPEK